MRYFLGIDVGGTKIRCAIVTFQKREAHVAASWKIPTPRGRDEFLEAIGGAIERAPGEADQGALAGVGLGAPGIISADRTTVVIASNTPQINDLAIASWVEENFSLPSALENDSNLFVFAEAHLGAAKEYKRVLGLTVGTGVGGGLINNGKIVSGAHGTAGEIGHMVIVAGGRQCSCGGEGHLEEYVSHRSFVREGGADPPDIENDARAGDARAKEIYEKAGTYLGAGIASAINLWDPEVVVVGGGIGNAGDLLLDPAREALKKDVLSPVAKEKIAIKKAHFGKAGGAVGAAYLVARTIQEES